MKTALYVILMVLLSTTFASVAADLSDLMSPDDVMLRKPAKKTEVKVEAPVDEVKSGTSTPSVGKKEETVGKKEETPAPVVEVKPEMPASRAEVKVATQVEAVNTNTVDVVVEKPAKVAKKKKNLKGRDAIITANRTDYDRKEGVILFDGKVFVDDEQYQMHADRLFVFLEGTNDLKRLVAMGHVAITNEDKSAWCARATYHKATGKIVMYSDAEIKAQLKEDGKKASSVIGEKITFWLNSEQVEVERPVITMPGQAIKSEGGAAGLLKKGGGK